MYMTHLQQSNSYSIYSMISVQNIIRLYMEGLSTQQFHLWICNYCRRIPPHEAYSWLQDFHIPSQFVLDLGVPLPCFFIITGFFIINHVDIIILECYPGWLPSKTCWPSMGYFTLVWEDPPDLGSMRLSRCHCHSIHGQICGTVLRCGQCPCVESICLGLGDILSLEGLSE